MKISLLWFGKFMIYFLVQAYTYFAFSSVIYCSSKPTGGAGGSFAPENTSRSGHFSKNMTMPSDWMCTICGCVNFARRTSCFQVCANIFFYVVLLLVIGVGVGVVVGVVEISNYLFLVHWLGLGSL